MVTVYTVYPWVRVVAWIGARVRGRGNVFDSQFQYSSPLEPCPFTPPHTHSLIVFGVSSLCSRALCCTRRAKNQWLAFGPTCSPKNVRFTFRGRGRGVPQMNGTQDNRYVELRTMYNITSRPGRRETGSTSRNKGERRSTKKMKFQKEKNSDADDAAAGTRC